MKYADKNKNKIEVFIQYEDDDKEYDFSPQEEVSKEKKLANYVTYSSELGHPLTEIYVDPGYELETVEPRYMELLEDLRDRFGERGFEPIPYYDLKSALYKIGEKRKRPLHWVTIIQVLRRLWRNGQIRRLVAGKHNKSKKKGRGEWYGIHYILYPKKKERRK